MSIDDLFLKHDPHHKHHNQCPVCASLLSVADITPCWACSWHNNLLAEFYAGVHTYNIFEMNGQQLVLCERCFMLFDVYAEKFSFPGMKGRQQLWQRDLKLVSPLPEEHLGIHKDRYCTNCRHRLPFLELLVGLRQHSLRQSTVEIQRDHLKAKLAEKQARTDWVD
jgi:hypothetical protein